MANQWLRLYSEFLTDPKVQMMSESDQRRLIMLFCLRCNGHVTLHDNEVTFLLRISNEEWLLSKATFVEKGFIAEDNELLNWDKRQFASDSSAARVAKFREKKKQDCNVTVTPQNRTDTEQIQNRTEKPSSAKAHAKDQILDQDLVKPELWQEFLKLRTKLKAVNSPQAIKCLITELKKLKDQGHDPDEVVNQSIRSSYKDVYPVKSRDPPKQQISNKVDFNKQQTELAKKRLFGATSPAEKDITHEAKAL
ncbi:MAG: hypothetical protein H0X02_04835 [Nitrosomonas sp.]|nr:hypothetical protein [Nitrosomonas sp.]